MDVFNRRTHWKRCYYRAVSQKAHRETWNDKPNKPRVRARQNKSTGKLDWILEFAQSNQAQNLEIKGKCFNLNNYPYVADNFQPVASYGCGLARCYYKLFVGFCYGLSLCFRYLASYCICSWFNGFWLKGWCIWGFNPPPCLYYKAWKLERTICSKDWILTAIL